ncbi:hypothetical protein H0178_23550 [Cytobacillus firmus]|nr:hypothetical protein [Cytobacillus firmus]
MIEKAINRSFAKHGIVLAALKQAKPVFLMELQNEDELEQPGAAKA